LKAFFISYNQADRAWAEWIAWTLEEAGYTTVIQAWDFRPGCSFVLEMQKAAVETRCTIAVLSTSYLSSLYTQPEWAAAFVNDPTGHDRRLIPVRVQECQVDGLLKAIVWIDLIDLIEEQASQTLLTGVVDGRIKPMKPPVFPGQVNGTGTSSGADRTVKARPAFPVEPPGRRKGPRIDHKPFNTGTDAPRPSWLVTLDELLQIPEVRDAVVACRVNCNAMCERIVELLIYKDLHDQLHQLQFHCFDPVVRLTRTGTIDSTNLDDLAEYDLTLRDIIDALRQIASRFVSSEGGADWIERLAEARRDLRAAIELSDPRRLRQAIGGIRRVLERQPSRINEWIVKSARELGLENLVQALGQVCGRMTDQVIEKERADELNSQLSDLARLTRDLSLARTNHARWQQLDVDLRLINVSIALSPDELLETWPDLKKSIDPLYAGHDEDWAVDFKAAGDRLDQAIVADGKDMTEPFRRFRRHAGLSFFRVDTNMKRLFEDLQKTGLPLATTLKVIQ